jgi:hypothetical protein
VGEVRIVGNEVTADTDERLINKALATYVIQQRQAKRELDAAEARLLAVCPPMGGNATERDRNQTLILAGDKDFLLNPEAEKAHAAYKAALAHADWLHQEITYLSKELDTRTALRTEETARSRFALAAVGRAA